MTLVMAASNFHAAVAVLHDGRSTQHREVCVAMATVWFAPITQFQEDGPPDQLFHGLTGHLWGGASPWS